ncbi:hypothetical protein QFZ22_006173 [Streptomyces canus]|uniref:SMODS and SLOG-associating 2TM effector domain-containing protein n=1 Tax=Streptomyces canus TaxID=58343 RepID=A0AAW8FL06_9ACTN|nr:SLATT domain-containing protein [Streptomyces canus]MDQ0910188.1 hypothetical protein [Streptomyces canus]
MGSVITYFETLLDEKKRARSRADRVEIINSAIKRAQDKQYKKKKDEAFWRKTYFIFGIPATALAAIAGLTAFFSTAGRIPAAILAVLAAFSSSIFTFLNPERRASEAKKEAEAWEAFELECRHLMSNTGNLEKQLTTVVDKYKELLRYEKSSIFGD